MEKEIIKIIAQNIGGHIPDQQECAKQIYQLFETRIKELEGTIEKMKAIACEKIEHINCVTSVDYPNDNETELITEREYVFNGCFSEITKTKCCGIAPITNENFCPNCGRKIVR